MARQDSATEPNDDTASGLSSEERAAIKDRAAELRAASRARGAEKAQAELQDVLAKIAAMQDGDRELAERVHALITAAAPALAPKLWYGMPAYAKNGKVVTFFQDSNKFKTRYSTLGFNDSAQLDDGAFWPTAYALTALGEAEEAAITDLIRRAAG